MASIVLMVPLRRMRLGVCERPGMEISSHVRAKSLVELGIRRVHLGPGGAESNGDGQGLRPDVSGGGGIVRNAALIEDPASSSSYDRPADTRSLCLRQDIYGDLPEVFAIGSHRRDPDNALASDGDGGRHGRATRSFRGGEGMWEV